MAQTTGKQFTTPDRDDANDMSRWLLDLAQQVEDKSAVGDTGWVAFDNIASGWTKIGGGWQARRRNGIVYVRGSMQNATFTGGPTNVARWPAAVTMPSGGLAVPISGNTAAFRQLIVATAGTVAVYSSGATNAFYTIDGHAVAL